MTFESPWGFTLGYDVRPFQAFQGQIMKFIDILLFIAICPVF